MFASLPCTNRSSFPWRAPERDSACRYVSCASLYLPVSLYVTARFSAASVYPGLYVERGLEGAQRFLVLPLVVVDDAEHVVDVGERLVLLDDLREVLLGEAVLLLEVVPAPEREGLLQGVVHGVASGDVARVDAARARGVDSAAGGVHARDVAGGDAMDDTLKQALALGRGYYLKKEYGLAEQYLTQVVEQNQSFADVYNMLGVIYHDQGQYQKALRAFEAALRINPGYTDAALNLAVTYNDTGKYKEAQETYRHALSRSGARQGKLDRFVQGKLANMYAEIAEVWLSSGMYPEAVREFRRALELGPSFVDIRAKLAGALRDQGDREAAIAEYEEVVRQSPAYVPARLNLGLSLLAAGRKDEAVMQWKTVLEISPGNRNAELYLQLGENA